LRFSIAKGTQSVPWFRSAWGRGIRVRSRQRSNPQLEPTLPKFNTNTKEESHGEEKEEEEQIKVVK
jgi:hypothetical protein